MRAGFYGNKIEFNNKIIEVPKIEIPYFFNDMGNNPCYPWNTICRGQNFCVQGLDCQQSWLGSTVFN
jgi:hypothetical protein